MYLFDIQVCDGWNEGCSKNGRLMGTKIMGIF